MGLDLPGGEAAWAEFEDLFLRNRHQGVDRVVKEARAHVERHGWQDRLPISDKWQFRHWIIDIYRSRNSILYSERRLQQLRESSFAIWVYHHGNALEPRPSHVAWDGVALPPDHPFWDLHFPPCGWGCSCYVSGTRSAAGVRRLGGDPEKELPSGWDVPLPETGRPLGVDWQFEGQRWPDLMQIVEAVLAGKTR